MVQESHNSHFESAQWKSKARQIFQYTGTFYLCISPGFSNRVSYVSQFEPFKNLIGFGKAPAMLQLSWAQQLGMQFGAEWDQTLRSYEGRCSS
jgi:hypothetical protein